MNDMERQERQVRMENIRRLASKLIIDAEAVRAMAETVAFGYPATEHGREFEDGLERVASNLVVLVDSVKDAVYRQRCKETFR